MFPLRDIQKSEDGLHFETEFVVTDTLKSRHSEILDAKPVQVKGVVAYDDGLYLLHYEMAYDLVLPSSRSLTPVAFKGTTAVDEVFVPASDATEKQDLIEESLALILEGDYLDVEESVVDNILLLIPLKILTPEEEAGAGLASGNDWEVLTQEDYQARQEEEKAQANPFTVLTGFLDDEED